MRVMQTTGNVGIGTASAGSRLEVYSDNLNTTVLVSNANSAGGVYQRAISGNSVMTPTLGIGGDFTGTYAGVRGFSQSSQALNSYGVFGQANGNSIVATRTGVYGYAANSMGIGVAIGGDNLKVLVEQVTMHYSTKYI
jgi:hypothetical protein